MSATSLSVVLRHVLAITLAATTLASASLAHSAPALPQDVAALVPGARAQGGGALTWYGLAVYHGYLWSTDGRFSFDEPFALDLHYQRSLKGAKIAERSVEEIRALGGQDASDLARWGSAMAQIFPDVRKGDHIAGVHVPGKGARFFHNGRPIGEIAEPKFARAFFGIWLDPRTSRPDLRTKLLGRS